MNDGSWLKLFRKIEDWCWFEDSKTFHVFIYLLLRANTRTSMLKGKVIKRGQVVTSYQRISLATGMSVSSARRAVENLVSTGEISTKPTNKYNLITINKYEMYQDKRSFEQADEQTDRQPTEQHHKNNRKKEKKNIETPVPEQAGEQKYIPQYWERTIPKQYHGQFQTEDDWWQFAEDHSDEVEKAYEL